MNSSIKTGIQHGVMAVVIQAIVFVVLKDLIAGALVGSALFYGREHAQAQYKLANGKSVKTLKWSDGANPVAWNLDGKLDFGIPVAMTFAVAIIGKLFGF